MSEIISLESSKRIAIIVAIESYRKGASTLKSVKYAEKDAIRFKDTLINHFGYLEEEIIMFINQDAAKVAFENDIPYYIKQLSKGHQLIFYYAGHGFYHEENKLTCWDSHPFNLTETSVSLKEVLLQPLEKSDCEQALVFLDCCSNELDDAGVVRDAISDLNDVEFEEFINSKKYHAVFMSCSPGEKSYSCDILQHGIWTWHLTEALAGNVGDAIVRDVYITDRSLQNYLSIEVPKYITKHIVIKETQRPFARLNISNDFLVRKLPKTLQEIDKSLPNFKFKYTDAIIRKIDYESIKNARGFLKGYSLPYRRSSSTIQFAQKVFNGEITDEIQNVYENTKKICGLRKADIHYGSALEGGSVECPIFRYSIEVDLDEDFANAKFIRRLQLRTTRKDLPKNFDAIFPIYLDELIIPIDGKIDFRDLVNKFENLVDDQGGELIDNEANATLEYITKGGTSITINVGEMELILTHYSPMRALALIDKSIDDLKRISSYKINLLE